MQELNKTLQDRVIYLLITSTEFNKLTFGSIKPEYFGTKVLADICEICQAFYNQFKEAPDKHFQDEFSRLLKRVGDNDTKRYIDYVKSIEEIDKPNLDYVITRVNSFIKEKELSIAAIEFAKLIQRGNFTEAENLMYSALKVGVERENIGIDYIKSTNYALRNAKDEILLHTGVSELDKLIGGFQRKWFIMLMGGYKGKKTWFMVHLGKFGLLNGLKVLHISHEMTGEEVTARYDMSCGGLTSFKSNHEVELTEWNEREKKIVKVNEIRKSIYDKTAVEKVRKSMGKFGGKLIIKKYPMGSCSMKELFRYVDYLENFYDFTPDVILNDYADIMEPMHPNMSDNDVINENYIWHKRLADEKNCLVVTVSQLTREAQRSHRVLMKHVSRDIRKLGNVDMGIAICQTDEQAEINQSVLWVVVARGTVMDCGCVNYMNLPIGQFSSFSLPYSSLKND